MRLKNAIQEAVKTKVITCPSMNCPIYLEFRKIVADRMLHHMGVHTELSGYGKYNGTNLVMLRGDGATLQDDIVRYSPYETESGEIILVVEFFRSKRSDKKERIETKNAARTQTGAYFWNDEPISIH